LLISGKISKLADSNFQMSFLQISSSTQHAISRMVSDCS